MHYIFYYFAMPFTFLHRMIPSSNKIGNITPARIPFFRLSPATLDTMPTSVGPPEQPTSPPSASMANIAVPPLGKDADALLKVPGHIIPTDNPHSAQQIRLICATGTLSLIHISEPTRPY